MKKFITERWYLHLIFGALLITPFIYLLIKYDSTFDIGIIGRCVVAGFGGLAVGFTWEWYHSVKNKSLFSNEDVIFTIIGAVIGTLIITL